jgi:hypothetical protein
MPMIRKKRPCCICHRWFLPYAKVKDRQVTCGDAKCQKEQHRKQCVKWNGKNADYFRSNYLQKKLDKTAKNEPTYEPGELSESQNRRSTSPSLFNLSVQSTGEMITPRLFIIIDYVIRIELFRFQKRWIQRVVNNKGSPSP